MTHRRGFLGLAAGAGLALSAGLARAAAPAAIPELKPLTGGVVPISPAERRERIARAQTLMRAQGLSALLIEPGSAMIYFCGVRWSRSERLTACVIPVDGDVLIVTPHFEEPSVRETLAVPAEVRVWQEDENPLEVVAGWLKDKKLASGVVGVEETVRYFIVDALQKALPSATVRNGAATAGSPHR